jgi:hypothetical protein
MPASMDGKSAIVSFETGLQPERAPSSGGMTTLQRLGSTDAVSGLVLRGRHNTRRWPWRHATTVRLGPSRGDSS